MLRRVLLGSVAVSAMLGFGLGPVDAISIREDVLTDGIANYYDWENRYPNVGAIRIEESVYCTGTLINSRTFLTAGHCFRTSPEEDNTETRAQESNVSFSPEAGAPAAANTTSIYVHRGYTGVIPGDDIALVALDRPVLGLTPVSLATGAPELGQVVTMVGFGLAAAGNDPEGTIFDYRRRVALNILDYIGPASGLPFTTDQVAESAQLVVATDFDAPGNPGSSSLGSVEPIAMEGSTMPGDSGGPIFITLPDGSLLQIGVLSGGNAPVGVEAAGAEVFGRLVFTYGDMSFWPAVWIYQDWLSTNNFLQSASSLPGDGLWSSSSHWSGGVVPSNSIGYVPGGAARYYDVSLSQPGTTVLDMSPLVDSLAVNHPQAALSIGSPYALTAEVGTALASGGISVDGALTTPWLRVSGGTLSGSGRVTAPQGVVQTGGTISPGGTGSIGTLSVTGPFTQEGGVLLAELSSSQADLLAVSGGAVRLAGGLQVALLGTPPAEGSSFTVVTGDAVDAGALAAPADIGAVTFSLSSSGSALQVLVGRQALSGFATDGNGASVGRALDGLRGDATFAPVLDSLDVLPASQIGRALDQVGGVSTTGPAVSRAMSAQFLGAASQRVAGVRAGGSLGASNARALRLLLTPEPANAALRAAETAPGGEQMVRPRLSGPTDGQGATVAEGPVFAVGQGSGLGSPDLAWGAWAQPYGMRASRRGNSTGSRYDTTLGGVSAGLDYRFRGNGVEEGLLAGVSLGYARADTGYRELTDRNKQRAYQAGVYGGWWQGPWSADAGLGFALNRYKTRRDVNFGTVNASAEGRQDGREYSAYAEARYRHEMAVGGPGRLELVPMAGLQALRLHTDGYTESGAGVLNLNVGSDQVTSLRSSIGAALAYPMALSGGGSLRPEVRARWSHEFGDTNAVMDARFASAQGAAFQIRSDDLGRDAALLGAGVEADLGRGVSLSAAYDAQLQKGYTAQAVTGRLRVAF